MLLTKLRLQSKWDQLRNIITKPEIYKEALIAYLSRLPDAIQVDWTRNDGYIIGTVVAGDKKFVTQGLDGDNFIEMVNESILTAFDIPKEYFEVIKKNKLFIPSEEERNSLRDMHVAGASFGLSNYKKNRN